MDQHASFRRDLNCTASGCAIFRALITGLHKSTVLRLTNSLGLYGFIQRDEKGRFSIGPSVWRLGLLFRKGFLSRDAVTPALRTLVNATGETASFYVRAGDQRVCLYRENSPDVVRVHAEEGSG